MFEHAANRLQAVRARGVGGARGTHYFQRGRASDETRVISMENVNRARTPPVLNR